MTKTVDNQEGILEQGLRILRRHKLVMLQAVIIIPVIAAALTLTKKDEYKASATLLFRQPPVTLSESASITDPTREATTNGELVALPVVAERAAAIMGNGIPPAEILASVSVTPSLNGETAAIAATTEDPELSKEMANAYGEAYIDFRRKADRSQVQEAINLAETSLAELPVGEREGAEGEALGEQLDKLRLTQALQTGGAELVQPASLPGSAESHNLGRNIAFGIILGLLFGFGLAALLDRFDRRVRSTEEMEALYGLPLLARIPRSRRLAKRQAEALGTQTQEGEAFRVLRTNLRFFNVDSDMRLILIVSPEEGDGKSTVANGLATTMAEMGDDVVLVEADLRKGGRYRTMAGGSALGLSNVLAGSSLDGTLISVKVPIPNLDLTRELAVLSSGPPPPNPSELLESGRMQMVLNQLGERFRYVIIDSPALSAVSDALALVPMVTEVVVVGGIGKTTRSAGHELVKQFALLQTKPSGIVVNFAEPEHGKYSHYYRSEPTVDTAASR